eukprot:scaffold8194_cov118-Cylindrotheca_fusiformis.AAC.3
MTAAKTTQILHSRSGNLGILCLNRPNALHALTLEMVHGIRDAFQDWRDDDETSLKAILLKSSKAKRPSFCAGGDVKAVYDNADPTFFHDEYQVNHAIATSRVPIISLWDGVVMGGGVGISIHGKYRVATENTLFAMPETAIGLFPDVGSMFWMTRLISRPLANFLGLTGQRLKAPDLIHSGLATHYVPSKDLADLEKALIDATISSPTSGDDDDDAVAASVLSSYHQTIPTDDSFLVLNQERIEKSFSAKSVEDIVSRLMENDDSEFGTNTLQTISKMSPTSLKLTFEGLSRGATECDTIAQDLEMEYRMAKACLRNGSDFFEGVRAVLVDKDHDPKWNPSTIPEVTEEMIEEFFAPTDDELVLSIPAPMPSSKL